MPHHEWGDSWFDNHGSDLYTAINYIMTFWKRYGRIGSHGKEKWGSFQDYPHFWNGGLHDLIWPGYVAIQNRFMYFKLDRYIIEPLTRYTGVHRLGLWYQRQIYNYAVQKMCKKYPEIIDELVADLAGYEMVKPGIFGKVDGVTINSKYWKPMK